MKKTIRLTERDLTNLVKRIIKEQRANRFSDMSDEEFFDKKNKPGQYYLSNYNTDTNDFEDYTEDYFADLERRRPTPTPPPTPKPTREPKKGIDEYGEHFNGSNMGLNSFPKELLDYADTLTVISLFNNNIREIPEWISEFKNLEILNLRGNPISRIPNSISELDGNLYRVSIDNHKEKLKKLLPNALIG